jgi:beta-N-acetylhexosaminidase
MGQVSSVSVAYEVGAVIGRELTSTGFNLNFAPVLDLNLHSDNPITARRAISPSPDRICTLARAIIRGLHDNSIVACGKYFPGHGETPEDSHAGIPVCNIDPETLFSRELKPYRNLIQNPPHLDMVMPAHIIYKKLDAEYPATVSKQILQEILRLQIGFKGLITTDDLQAQGIRKRMTLPEATRLGMSAGVDIFLVSSNIDDQVSVLETLLKEVESENYPQHMIERGFRRVRDIKARHFRVLRTIDRQHARELVGNREHQRIARRLRDGK